MHAYYEQVEMLVVEVVVITVTYNRIWVLLIAYVKTLKCMFSAIITSNHE